MASSQDYCPNCFHLIGEQADVCPYCGFHEFNRENQLALPTNWVLKNRYIAGKILGAGGFGITYKSFDIKHQRICAIKEYVPLENASRNKGDMSLNPTSSSRRELFEYGKKKFLDEADTLKKLQEIADVVKIYDCFSENGTAYFVMEYLDGSNLNAVRRQAGGRLPYHLAYKVILEAVTCMEEIHSKGNIFHRDISPENIMITRDNHVKVIDFGTAKYIHGKKSQNLSVVLKPGYAPPEQYTSSGKQGAFTDVYAMASTFYYILTGKKVPSAPDRLDPDGENRRVVPLEEYSFLGEEYAQLTIVLDNALKVNAKERTQTMKAFAQELIQYNEYWETHVKGKKSGGKANGESGGGATEVQTVVDPEPSGEKEDPGGLEATKLPDPPEKDKDPVEVPTSPPPPRYRPYLQGMTKPVKGYRYFLPVNTMISIGRSQSSNIMIPLHVIGRKHLELFFDTYNNLFYIADNHSVNQTVLNGVVCDPGKIYPAQPGSWLSLARDSCIFRLEVIEG
ncbi:MAG: protein kinase [Eubacterium sp.]|nr:protein kinase [Eubacterium sp.]